MLHRHQWRAPRITQVSHTDFYGNLVSYSNFTWICTTPGCAEVKTKKQKGIFELPTTDHEIEQLESLYANSPESEQ